MRRGTPFRVDAHEGGYERHGELLKLHDASVVPLIRRSFFINDFGLLLAESLSLFADHVFLVKFKLVMSRSSLARSRQFWGFSAAFASWKPLFLSLS